MIIDNNGIDAELARVIQNAAIRDKADKEAQLKKEQEERDLIHEQKILAEGLPWLLDQVSKEIKKTAEQGYSKLKYDFHDYDSAIFRSAFVEALKQRKFAIGGPYSRREEAVMSTEIVTVVSVEISW